MIMKRYVAFLRGVSPMNAKMPELKRCFERAGFRDVVTLLSSGNVAFSAATATPAALQRQAEAAMAEHLPRSFLTIVRPRDALQALIAADPFRLHRLQPGAKRVITFLRTPCRTPPALPISRHDATIFAVDGKEVFSAYLPGEDGPKFMTLIETTFGKDITTRTWDTVAKCARA
jgi:uncharacterized protein (DUF1697 family)